MGKKKFQTVIFILLLFLLGGQYFYNTKVTSVLEEVGTLEIKKEELERNVFEVRPYVNNKSNLQNQIEKELDNIKELNEIIPQGKNMSPHVDYLYHLSKRHSVVGHTANFYIDGTGEAVLPTFTIGVTFEGKQDNLMKLIDELQSNENPYSVTEFSLSPIGEGEYIVKLKIKSIFSK